MFRSRVQSILGVLEGAGARGVLPRQEPTTLTNKSTNCIDQLKPILRTDKILYFPPTPGPHCYLHA